MGGRGGSSGFSAGGSPNGRGGSLNGLLQQINNNQTVNGPQWMHQGDYTDENNPALMQYQQKEDDKTANFLAGTDNKIDLNDPAYADGYVYHDIPLNKLLLRLGVGKGATVLSDSDFDKYVQQSGQQVMYRGWSNKGAADRFVNTTHNHVGNGRYGDGYYFSPDKGTAKAYSGDGTVTKMALSPKARVISYSDLVSKMSQASSKLQNSLRKTGGGGSGRTFASNKGEAQYALKLGYNVIDVGGGYLYGITNDAFVVSKKY